MQTLKAHAKSKPYLGVDPNLEKGLYDEPALPPTWTVQPRNGEAQNSSGSEALLALLNQREPRLRARAAAQSSNAEKIKHLFSRASFGLTVAEMQALALIPPEQAVEALLADSAPPEPPGDWVSEPFDRRAFRQMSREERQAWRQLNRRRINEMRGWWLELMMSSAMNLREKMTLFWHGHFTSDIRSIELAQFLYLQNATWRKHALGNFRDFLKDMYKDPGMLFYLNGVQNRASHPNENFARELLELFTMGIGNYTEQDIKEAARAFTGWQVDTINLTSYINERLYDRGTKTFLGRTGNFYGDHIIDIILEQEVTARFICRKLYEFFVSRELNQEFIDELAKTFRDNDYEIKPVLRQMFTSDFFYSDQVVASLIKSPVEMAVSNARMFSVKEINLRYLLRGTHDLGHDLLNPPNVAGWPGQRSWISPTTYVGRNALSESFVSGSSGRGRAPIKFDPLEFGYSYQTTNARDLLDAAIDHLLLMPIKDQTRESLLASLVGTADPNDWSLAYAGADRQVVAFLVHLVRLPEFHLT